MNVLAKIYKARQGIRREMRAQRCALTPSQFLVLQSLSERSGKALQKEISEDTGLFRSTIGPILVVLEKGGLVKTGGVEKDKRLTVISITPRGQAAVNSDLDKYYTAERRFVSSEEGRAIRA